MFHVICVCVGGVSWVAQANLELALAKDELELLIFLPLSPNCQDDKHMLPCLVYVALGIKPRTLYTLVEYSTNSCISSLRHIESHWRLITRW